MEKAPIEFRNFDVAVFGDRILPTFDIQPLMEILPADRINLFYQNEYEVANVIKEHFEEWIDHCLLISYDVQDDKLDHEDAVRICSSYTVDLSDLFTAVHERNAKRIGQILNGELLDAAHHIAQSR